MVPKYVANLEHAGKGAKLQLCTTAVEVGVNVRVVTCPIRRLQDSGSGPRQVDGASQLGNHRRLPRSCSGHPLSRLDPLFRARLDGFVDSSFR